MILYAREKHILLYFMWNFEGSSLEIRVDIFHFGRLSDKKFLRIGFLKTDFKDFIYIYIPRYVLHIFCLICPALSDEKNLSIDFHMTCHFFRFQGIANISSFVCHTFCMIYPALSDENFLSIGFLKTRHIFRFQGIANISSYVFHTFCLVYPALLNKKILSMGFHMTCHFFKELQIFQVLFPHFCMIYPALSNKNKHCFPHELTFF